ncbi:hypothetical protein Scep_017715 [Stephania cephalantha]|uniref:DNA polymerase n=1 Tax=Stephania cephalantha TaxID=152367 RepID=A0AAP0IQ26_9MAGN
MAPRKSSRAKERGGGQQLQQQQQQPGIFDGMVVFFIQTGLQSRRIQIWKQKLLEKGAKFDDGVSRFVTHVFAKDSEALLQLGREQLQRFKGWLEDSLKEGKKVSEEPYILKREVEEVNKSSKPLNEICPQQKDGSFADEEIKHSKKAKKLDENSDVTCVVSEVDKGHNAGDGASDAMSKSPDSLDIGRDSSEDSFPRNKDSPNKDMNKSQSSLAYCPPNLNQNVTDMFGKLINIYRALGDDRRSFSYYKAISVIEKLPFKIESGDQVKHLPAIGKAMQDHIHEIVTTGKLSKLEHFETDEKVKTINLFGEVWGIGPATALKLYEKGHRTLEDLEKEDTLTNAQRLGLKYFDDIKKRIPRHEVEEMERLLQKVGEGILPGIVIICGGSFRRGKATCGDMDIIITHPDGKSHRGFLNQYVRHLKDMNFLREDLIFSTHSEQGTDSGVDTYFGLCTYPGREQRLRIDFKVYPRSIYAFGLIAWTGNDVLNRRLRLLAESKGYRLDDTGLFLAAQTSGGKRARANVSLSFDTEKEVFDFLGFPCLEPQERNL